MINKSTIAPLVLGYQVAEVNFFDKYLQPIDRPYYYKLPHKNAVVGDLAVVLVERSSSESEYKVVQIIAIHDAEVLDIDSDKQYKWAVGTLNTNDLVKACELETKLLRDIDKRRQSDMKRSVMAELMLNEQDIAKLTNEAFTDSDK